MEVKNIWAVYFSPTGGTKKFVRTVADEIAAKLNLEVRTIDFTKPAARQKEYQFNSDDVVIAGTCVYAGRVPNKIMGDWKACFKGNGALALAICAFGNRSFDDGLMELKQILQGDGFKVFAAAAFANRHAFATNLAPNRPTLADMEEVKQFAKKAADILTTKNASEIPSDIYVDGNNPVGAYYTPLRDDGEPATALIKAKPKTREELCDQCGACASRCPVAAIDFDDCTLVPGICIKCHSCVKVCHTQAKYFDDDNLLSHIKMLERTQQEPKPNRFFF